MNNYMDCSFASYTSGYISEVTLLSPCPNGCTGTETLDFLIPVTTRGDVYQIGGTFTVITKYSYIDVGQGTFPNSIVNVEATITQTYITNQGCNTIEEICTIWMSFKLINYVPPASGGGRIMIILPSQLSANLYVCGASFDMQNNGITCSMS